jgi:hypothetical protein
LGDAIRFIVEGGGSWPVVLDRMILNHSNSPSEFFTRRNSMAKKAATKKAAPKKAAKKAVKKAAKKAAPKKAAKKAATKKAAKKVSKKA